MALLFTTKAFNTLNSNITEVIATNTNGKRYAYILYPNIFKKVPANLAYKID